MPWFGAENNQVSVLTEAAEKWSCYEGEALHCASHYKDSLSHWALIKRFREVWFCFILLLTFAHMNSRCIKNYSLATPVILYSHHWNHPHLTHNFLVWHMKYGKKTKWGTCCVLFVCLMLRSLDAAFHFIPKIFMCSIFIYQGLHYTLTGHFIRYTCSIAC